MADVDVNDVLEITWKGKFNSADDIVNVFQARITDPQTGTKAEAIVWVTEWVEDLVTTIINELHPTYELVEVIVENLTQDTFIGQDVVGQIGINTSEALPPQVCALIMARTPVPEVDGRKYLGVFGEDTQSQGIWNAGAVTALQAFASVWSSTLVATNSVAGVGVIVTKVAGSISADHDIEGTRV
ncbi:unnamed protein product, partial [marine sediment metagenome]